MTARPLLRWISLPHPARLYVASVTAVGTCAFAAFFPLSIPRPLLFLALLAAGCGTSIWKVNLPMALTNGSTLSVSYAADLTALLLLGPQQAMVIAVTASERRPPIQRCKRRSKGQVVTTIMAAQTSAGRNGSRIHSEAIVSPLMKNSARVILIKSRSGAGIAVS